MSRIACLLAIALLAACTVDVAVAPDRDSGESDLKVADSGFATRSTALTNPGIELKSQDLATIEVGTQSAVDVPVIFEVAVANPSPITDEIRCRRDGLIETVYGGLQSGQFTHTFTQVPRGMHDLACSLFIGADLVQRATRRVFVSGDCTGGDCDDGNPCTNDPCINGKCVYEALPNCCLSDDACPKSHTCVQLTAGPKVCSPCASDSVCDDGANAGGTDCAQDKCNLDASLGPYALCEHPTNCNTERPLRGCTTFTGNLGGWIGPAAFSHQVADLTGSASPGSVRFQSASSDNGPFCLRSPEFVAPPAGPTTWTVQFWHKLVSGSPVTLSVTPVYPNAGGWAQSSAPPWTKQIPAPAGQPVLESIVPVDPLGGGTIKLDICVTVAGAAVWDLDDVCIAAGTAPTLVCKPIVHMTAGGKRTDKVYDLHALGGSAGYPLQFSKLAGPSWLGFYPALYDGHLGQWLASPDLRSMAKEQAGYHAVTIRASDTVLQAQCTTSANIRHPSGLLIWAPGAPDHAFQPLRDAAKALGMSWLDTPALANVGDLSAFHTIIGVLGIGVAPHFPSAQEAERLIAHWQSGRLALAGSAYWSANDGGWSANQKAMRQAFGTTGYSAPGQPNLEPSATGFALHLDTNQVPAAPQPYAIKEDENLWANNDHLTVTNAATSCLPVLRVQPFTGPAFWTEIACEHQGGNRTIAMSAPFGAFKDALGHASTVEHAKRILQFLSNGFPPCASSSDCNDNDACTTNACVDGKCDFAAPVNCNDANDCTVDSCSKDTGCAHYADPNATCNDTTTCTGDEHCQAGVCITGGVMACDDTDGNPCTSPSCIAWVGCVNFNNANACNDQNPCTENDPCQGGVCAGANQTVAATGYCAPDPIGPLPPDPTALAPPLPTTTVTSFSAAVAFLWSGANAIQKPLPNAAPLNFDPRVIAVSRGKVMQRSGNGVAPLPKAKVWVPAHPEWGYVLTRIDGSFDFVAEQGAGIVVEFVKPGFFPVHRKIDVPRRDYVVLAEVVLVQPDPVSKVLQFPTPPLAVGALLSSVVQGPPGSTKVDDGPRQTMLLVPPETTAVVHGPGGALTSPPQLTLRVTEYTVGPNGPAAMPANLPPASGYTWCGEFSADEVMAAGPKAWVEFGKPLSVYLDNFLDLPVGRTVPLGYYDRTDAVWKQPRPKTDGNGNALAKTVGNALVIAAGIYQGELKVWLTPPTQGLATPGLPNALLDAMGMAAWERDALKQRLQMLPGGAPAQPKSFWRFQIDHMTPWDANLGYSYVAEGPTEDPPGISGPPDDTETPTCKKGSIIECETQGLGEVFPVVGTPLALRYQSRRTPGGRQRLVEVPAPTATTPAKATSTVNVAGQTVPQTGTGGSGGKVFQWDGKDAFGRTVNGYQLAAATTTYAYNNKRITVPISEGSIGFSITLQDIAISLGCTCASDASATLTCHYPDGSLCMAMGGTEPTSTLVKFPPPLFGTQAATTKGLATVEVPVLAFSPNLAQRTNTRTVHKRIGNVAPDGDLGGLSLGVHHVYDPGSQTLVLGSGKVRNLPTNKLTVSSHAGAGTTALSTVLAEPPVPMAGIELTNKIDALVVTPHGYTYFASEGNLYELNPAGNVRRACQQAGGFAVRSLALAGPITLLVGMHNNLNGVVHKTQVGAASCGGAPAYGNASATSAGNWGPAKDAKLLPSALAVAPDGAVFIAEGAEDPDMRKVRRIDPSGVIAPYLGSGLDPDLSTSCEDIDQPATQVCIGRPSALAVDGGGNLFVGTDTGRLFWVSGADGRVRRIHVELPATQAGTTLLGLYAGATNVIGYCQFGGNGQGTVKLAMTGQPVSGVWRLLGADQTLAADSGAAQVANLLGGSAGDLAISNCTAVAHTPQGDWYAAALVDYVAQSRRILRVTPQGQAWTGGNLYLPSEDGSEAYEFTADGRHVSTKDATTGATLWAFQYDPPFSGKLVSVTDADGILTTITRDAAGKSVALSGPPQQGAITKIALNDSGLASKFINPAGETTTLVYETAQAKHGLLSKLIQPSGDISTFAWDDRGRLQKDTNAAGQYKQLATNETVAENKAVTTVTTNLGRVTTYDTKHNPDGSSERKTVTPAGLLTLRREFITTAWVMADGTVKQTAEAGSQRANYFRRDPDGTATWLRNGPDTQWGAGGQQPVEAFVSVPAMPAGETYGPALLARQSRVEEITKQAGGQPVPLVNRLVTDSMDVTDLGVLGSVSFKQKAEIVAGTWQVTSTSAQNRVVTTYFDASYRPERTVVSGLPETKTAYNTDGTVATVTTTSALDQNQVRTVSYTYAGGRVSKVTATGTISGTTNTTTASVEIGTDAAWRVSSQKFTDGPTITLARAAAGRLAGVSMPKSAVELEPPVYSFTYGKADQPKNEALPAVAPKQAWLTQFEYDNDGNLAKATRPDGKQVKFERNGLAQVENIEAPNDAEPNDPVVTTVALKPEYDAAGRVKKIAHSKYGSLGFAWRGVLNGRETWLAPDGNDPPGSNGPAANWSVLRDYDSALRLRRVGVLKPDVAGLANYHWVHAFLDGDGLLTGLQLRSGNLESPYPVTVAMGTYGRDAANGLLTGRLLGAVAEARSYDGFADPLTYLVEMPATAQSPATLLYREDYTKRDGLGRLMERKIKYGGVDDTWTYTYDGARGWLKTAHKNGVLVGEWKYDVRGNRTSSMENGVTTTAAFDVQDKQLTAGDRTYTYGDDLGRVTGESEPGVESRSYTWDAGGRLVKAVLVKDGATTTVDYVLDAAGRRIGRKLNGVVQAGWLYDGALRPTAQLDANGKLVLRFAYGSLGHSPDAAVKFNTETGAVAGVYWFVHDQVGSVVAVVDTATGGAVERCSYQPWGKRDCEPLPPPPFTHPFGFAGGLHDLDTGLVRFGAREYDPRIGRWLARDPIGLAGGWNPAAYVGNDPIGATDPSGLRPDFDMGPIDQCRALDSGCREDFLKVAEVWEAIATVLFSGPRCAGRSPGKDGYAFSGHPRGPLKGSTAGRGRSNSGKGGGPAGRPPEKLTDWEVDQLTKAGHHPHSLKPNSKYDLYKDGDGNISVHRKGGSGVGDPTNLNINDFK